MTHQVPVEERVVGERADVGVGERVEQQLGDLDALVSGQSRRDVQRRQTALLSGSREYNAALTYYLGMVKC